MFPGVFHSTRDVEFYSILKAEWKVFLKHHSELNPCHVLHDVLSADRLHALIYEVGNKRRSTWSISV